MFIKLNDVRYNTDKIIAYGIESRTNRFYLLFDDNHIHYIDEGDANKYITMLDKVINMNKQEVVYGFKNNSYI